MIHNNTYINKIDYHAKGDIVYHIMFVLACRDNCIRTYITCYLKAAAPLLNVLERLKSQRSTRLLFIYITYVYIGLSPNRSSIVCISTSNIAFVHLVDLFFPNFVYIVDIRLFICCLFFNTGKTLLDDRFFCNLVCIHIGQRIV
jgi:hypothetical protein